MKPVSCLVTVLLAGGALSLYAFPQRANGILPPTRVFSLDGKWYSVGKTAGGNSLLREELRKRGIDIRVLSPRPPYPGDLVVDPLSEIPPETQPRLPPLPPGLHMENTMGISSGTAFLDVTFGTISRKGTYVRKKLAERGWTVMSKECLSAPVCIGTIRNGRETAIVVLEEKEGDFLYIRQRQK